MGGRRGGVETGRDGLWEGGRGEGWGRVIGKGRGGAKGRDGGRGGMGKVRDG